MRQYYGYRDDNPYKNPLPGPIVKFLKFLFWVCVSTSLLIYHFLRRER